MGNKNSGHIPLNKIRPLERGVMESYPGDTLPWRSFMKEVEGVSCVQTLIVVLLYTPNCHIMSKPS